MISLLAQLGSISQTFIAEDTESAEKNRLFNEVLVVGNWLVTYWPDHAVRELRVVRLEQVGD